VRDGLGAARAQHLAGPEVVAQPWTGWQAPTQAAAAVRAIVALGTWATAPWATVVGLVVVVIAQTEEPDQPEDQQADVENAESDHEDPAFGADTSDRSSDRASVQRPACDGRQPSYLGFGAVVVGVVGFGSGMYVTL
jgi:hypothetical protein